MAPTAQLNVRMNPEVKEAGDMTLDLYGISPSDLVRSLWEKIAQGKEALEQVVTALAADPAPGAPKHASLDLSEMSIGDRIDARYEQLAEELGLDLATFPVLSDEEVEELIYQDMLEKWEARRVH